MNKVTMATIKQGRATVKGYEKPVVSDAVTSHANDPYVLDKLAKAKEFLGKHPLPAHLLKK